MTESDNYYRRRMEEELAAAERSADPSISQIHRDMAQRYLERLNGEAGAMDTDIGMPWAAGGAYAGPGHFSG